MLLMLVLLSALLAWKYNQRNRIIAATNQVDLAGGQATYRWQTPTVVGTQRLFRSAYSARSVKTTRTRSDGSTETVWVTKGYMNSAIHPFVVNVLNTPGSLRSENLILRFFSNSDILVDAVWVPELNVDREFVAALQDLDGLRIVQICRNQKYFQTQVAGPNRYNVTAEQKRTELDELSKPFEDAKSIIHKILPHVKVIDGVLE